VPAPRVLIGRVPGVEPDFFSGTYNAQKAWRGCGGRSTWGCSGEHGDTTHGQAARVG